ncbi:MAG: diaminopimelate decarboxylase [Methanophagales archaeon]|nr:diaminopimelate decarboxylase [Methanophagales archaeon]
MSRAGVKGGGDGNFIFGGVDVVDLAEQYGTPLYITDENKIRENYRSYKTAFETVENEIYFAVKANGNLALLRILASEGAGADVFSSGELRLVELAGIPKDKVLMNGNSKSEDELIDAVESEVKISVDSLEELQTLSAVAVEIGKEAEIAIRVNPDVSPDTHPKIATGLSRSKFGLPYQQILESYEEAKRLPNIVIKGIHCHIGSQILEISVFKEATEKMMKLVEELYDRGIELEFVDLGGGLGIPYNKTEEMPGPTPEDLAEMILPAFKSTLKSLGINLKLILEPGRSIVGPASILLSRVNTIKRAYSNFVAIDAGFNLLLRPSMYGAYHEVIVANKLSELSKLSEDKHELAVDSASAPVLTTVVGPVCESGDIIAKDRMLRPVKRGDLIAILDVGAYGFSMSSQYNGRPRCAEVLVCDGMVDVIRSRETVEDLLRNQIIPQRLERRAVER